MGECRCLRCLHVQCSDQKACSNEPITQRGGSPAALCFLAHSAPKMRTRGLFPLRRAARVRPRGEGADLRTGADAALLTAPLQTPFQLAQRLLCRRGSGDARVSVRGCVGRHREELLADVQIQVTCGVTQGAASVRYYAKLHFTKRALVCCGLMQILSAYITLEYI